MLSEGRHQVLSYAEIKSSLEIPDWVQMVRSVEAFIFRWLGMVRGVLVPSGFIRSIEMCSLSRIILKPKISNAFMTLCLGASTGNLGIKPILQPLQQKPQGQVAQLRALLPQMIRCENGLRI